MQKSHCKLRPVIFCISVSGFEDCGKMSQKAFFFFDTVLLPICWTAGEWLISVVDER